MNNRKHTFKVLFLSCMILGSAAVMADHGSHGGDDNNFVATYGKEYGFIHVNQGAMLRIIDLQQRGFAYIQENDANPVK